MNRPQRTPGPALTLRPIGDIPLPDRLTIDPLAASLFDRAAWVREVAAQAEAMATVDRLVVVRLDEDGVLRLSTLPMPTPAVL